ncbi:MAG: glucokinase [Alphaproteobacteria bacterium]
MTGRARAKPELIADIGGTNARFALRVPGRAPTRFRSLPTRDYRSLAGAARAYQAGTGATPRRAAIAVASPVTGDRVRLTNRSWSFSRAGLRRALGLDALTVINDFVAVAHAVPRLRPADWVGVGGGAGDRRAPIALIGPGTGLGVALLVPGAARTIPVATEGGHVTLAAVDAGEAEIIQALRAQFSHVSAERALSGPGLVNLYRVIAGLRGAACALSDPAAISDAALAKSDPVAVKALDAFCGFLGGVAGDLALSTGARGGVYIAGGIVPRFADRLARTQFRRRFNAKGRFKSWLAPIPVRVITRPHPALLGLCRLLDETREG